MNNTMRVPTYCIPGGNAPPLRRTSPAVSLGLEVPSVGDEEAYAERIDRLSGDLPVVFFVKNSSLFVGKLIQTTDEQATAPTAEDGPAPPSSTD